MKSQFVEQQAALQTAREAAKVMKAQLEQERKANQAAQKENEKTIKAKIDEQRQILDLAQAKELAKKDSDHKRETDKLQEQLKEMGRRLEKKTANEIGEGSEVDLFEALKGAFPDDFVNRVKKGEAGADIHQTVKHRGENCGLIVFDSKNRMQWKYEFAKKLRQDQIAAEAEHAILSTTVFPTGKKELCVEENVIVVNPLRVIHIASILRDAMVKLHLQGLSIKERKTKVEQIYQFITSDEFAQKLSEAVRLTDQILNIDVKEKKEHDKTWKERGTTLTNLKNLLREIDDDVYGIVGGKGTEEPEETEITHDKEVPF
jgi:hypothetical protein